MNRKLLKCKREAKDFVQSKDPPRKADEKKHGYMAIMKQLWDNSEFADLNISTQNLRDQAARIEKSLGSAGSTIREESNTANDLLQSNVDNQETSSEDLEQDNYEFNNDTISPQNLHSTNSQVPEENETPAEVKNIFQEANWFLLQWWRTQGISAIDSLTVEQRKDQQIKISSTSMRLLNS